MGIKINIQLGNCKEKIKVKYFDKEIEKLEKIRIQKGRHSNI